ALEEPDLRALLLEHRSRGAVEEAWLAAIVARRSLGANHLWQDLGLFSRDDLSRLLMRHFRPLAVRNSSDMKWKKFFYRALCERDGVVVCKAPNCAICDDVSLCFGGEAGEPLTRLQDNRRR
ncbi:MAG: nitrogen fixation protein NifQ, partial [Rhodospirillales bacterium]